MQNTSQAGMSGFLARLLIRSHLNREEQNAILGLPGQVEVIPSLQDFRPAGQMIRHAVLIVQGTAGCVGQTKRGSRQITAFHIAGDVVDLSSVVQPRTTFTVQALSALTIIRIPHNALRNIAVRYPAIAEAFWRDLTVDAAILAQWAANIGTRDAKSRIAHLLCEMGVRYRASGECCSYEYPLPLVQSQVAEAAGLSTVHVNRTIQALRPYVVVAGGLVTIRDWAALSEIGDFDGAYLQTDLLAEERLRLFA